MAGERRTFLNAEKTLFVLLVLLLGFFVWRVVRIEPLPDLPGAPKQRGVKMVEGYPDPAGGLGVFRAPDFAAAGVRNPFDSVFESLQVLAATVASHVRVSTAGATAEVQVEYRILPRAVSKFEFLLPADVQLVSVEGSGVDRTGPEVKNLGADGNHYTVRLRWPVPKKYTLTLHLAWSKRAGGSVVSIPEMLFPDATHERGVIAVSAAGPGLQVSVKTAQNVTPVPLDSLPAGLTWKGCFAAFRYASHPYGIDLGCRRGTWR